MSRNETLLERISDSINPIVVKELRQAVQSKFVVGALFVLLLLQLAVVGIYLVGTRNDSANFDAGQQVFMVLYGFLLGTALLFVPIYTAVRFFLEKSDTHVDLLFVTTIRPISIIWGKHLAAFVLALLIYSACLPFMTFTYFLRGIDLPSIFVLLTLSFAVVMLFSSLAVLLASLHVGKIFRIFLSLVALGSMLPSFVSTIVMSFEILRGGVGSRLADIEFWGPALTIASAFLMVVGLLFSASTALLTPASANRALPVRLFLTGMWVATGLMCYGVAYWGQTLEPIIAWIVLVVFVFGCSLIFGVCEREEWGRRVARTIPRSPLKRTVAFLFYSGAAGGVAWGCLIILATILLAVPLEKIHPGFRDASRFAKSAFEVGSIALYVFCYALTAVWLRRTFPILKIKPETTWVAVVVLIILGSSLPMICGYLVSPDTNLDWWMFGNPFAVPASRRTEHRHFFAFFVTCWAAVAVVLNLRWALAQIRNFRPAELVSSETSPL